MRRSTIGTVSIASLWVTVGLLAVPVVAQSPAPATLPPPTPTPTRTADSGIEWPPMGFEGGDPALMVFTSDCGVWGEDPIALHGEGADGTADLVVTFDTYDAEAFQWFGRATGTHVAPNGYTEVIDEPALIYYDMDGHWILVTRYAAQIRAHGCDPLPSELPASGAPGG